MRSNFRDLISCCLGLACALAAQTGPTPLPSDLKALAARVDKAHHPDGVLGPVTRFDAALEVHLVAADKEQAGQVDLDVRYMRYVRPDKKVRHLIRYEVLRAGRPIERGRDQHGFWHLFQGEARNLTEADVEDRTACQRDIMLARQLVRFLDPGAVLRSLTNPTVVKQEGFRMGRLKPIACETVEGSLAEFPLLRLAGGDQPVRIKMYVSQADGSLVAVLVRPERGGVAIEAEAELIRFAEPRLRSGMLVPKQLVHSFRGQDGRMRVESRVLITSLDLRPEFVLQDLDRPKK